MTFFKTIARFAGLLLCVVAFAGTAAAGNGGGKAEKEKEQGAKPAAISESQSGKGSGNGKSAAQKPEKQAPQKAEKSDAKAAPAASTPAKAESKPAKAESKPAQAESKPAKVESKPAKTSQTTTTTTTSTPNQGESSKVLTVNGAPCASPVPGAKVEGGLGTTINVSATQPIAKVTVKSGQGATVVGSSFSSDFKSGTITLSKDVSNYIVWTCGQAVTQQPPPSDNGDNGEQGQAKVMICHRTGSTSNPYVIITIARAGWDNGHSGHDGDKLIRENVSPGEKPSAADVAFAEANCRSVSAVLTTDVCPNMEGNQQSVPPGHIKDEKGKCAQPQVGSDVCPNVVGMQTTLPAGLVQDASGNCVAPSAVAAAAAPAPLAQVAGAVSPAAPKKAKPAKAKPAGGVLGAVATAPEAIAETATGELPFTGIPLWIAALLGGGLLATGLVLRRASATR